MGEPGPDLRDILASCLHPRPDRLPGRASAGRSRSDLGCQPDERLLELVDRSPVCLVAHADRLQQRQGSSRDGAVPPPSPTRRSGRPSGTPIPRRAHRTPRRGVTRPRTAPRWKRTRSESSTRRRATSIMFDPGLDRVDAQSAGDQFLGQFPRARADLDHLRARTETRELDRGTDDLVRIAGAARVVCLGSRVEHAAIPPWFGHHRTLARRGSGVYRWEKVGYEWVIVDHAAR